MRIAVCVKQVPDTMKAPRIAPGGASIDASSVSFVVNPYDEYAIEEALRIKEAQGAEVILVMLGPESGMGVLRKALAMGADSATLLKTEQPPASPLPVAKALASYLKGKPSDLILFGKQAVDMDNAQVGVLVATLLGMPCISDAVRPSVAGGKLTAEREVEGGRLVVEAALPAVMTAEKSDHEPRYASIKGIMDARKKQVEIVEVSLDEPKMSLKRLEEPPERAGGRIIGEGAGAVPALVQALRDARAV